MTNKVVKSNSINVDKMSHPEDFDQHLLAPSAGDTSRKEDINGTQISGGGGNQQRSLSGEFGFQGGKKKNAIAEIKQELTSGWFDTNEEFEQHRKRVTRKLHASVRDFKDLGDDGKLPIDDGNIMDVLASEGGKKGYTVMGGPNAFDAHSNQGAYSAMLSEMDVLSRYDGKWDSGCVNYFL